MKGFSGFPQKSRMIRIPGQFFSDLLPEIDHLAELKISLYCFWWVQRKGERVVMREADFHADDVFMSGLAPRRDQRIEALRDGLERAVARGTLLQAQTTQPGKEETFYVLNTAKGQAVIKGLVQGRWQPDLTADLPLDLRVERPNIFTLYEQNIGPLTPIIADHLRDLEELYPPAWIEEAIILAAEANVRRLSYIEGILGRWETEGRGDRRTARTGTSGERFVRGQFKDEIET